MPKIFVRVGWAKSTTEVPEFLSTLLYNTPH